MNNKIRKAHGFSWASGASMLRRDRITDGNWVTSHYCTEGISDTIWIFFALIIELFATHGNGALRICLGRSSNESGSFQIKSPPQMFILMTFNLNRLHLKAVLRHIMNNQQNSEKVLPHRLVLFFLGSSVSSHLQNHTCWWIVRAEFATSCEWVCAWWSEMNRCFHLMNNFPRRGSGSTATLTRLSQKG